jgi:glycolate oxidase iron-sulfur subunit
MNTLLGPMQTTGEGRLFSGLSEELLVHCMRCGFCLSVCPTFSIYHTEKASPRGRLALIHAVDSGKLEFTAGFHDAMNLCLGCLACQTACPAGVEYGHLVEIARDRSEAHQKSRRSGGINTLRIWLLEHLLRGPHGLEVMLPFLKTYQSLGIQKLNLGRLVSGPVGAWERMLPALTWKSAHQTLGEVLPARTPRRGRVGLLTGCLENTLLTRMCTATAQVISWNGFDVVIPPAQECCGALPGHIGELDLARERARRNIDVFESAGVETVISDAAGCSAQLKEYGHLLSDDPLFRHRARKFSSLARDATEFLAEIMPLRAGMRELRLRVAYDDPCHLVHAQGIKLQPRQLLESIPGVELVRLSESDWCCGSAGTYNLTHSKEADLLLERKMEHVKKLEIDVLATANIGCHLQLAAGVRRFGVHVEVLHVVEILSRAYGLENPGR